MKKLLTLLTAVVLVLVAVFSVACIGGNSIVGTYKFKAVYLDENGGGSIYEIGDNYENNILTEDACILKLLDNNTLEFTYTIGNTTKKLDGVWFQNGEYTIGIQIEYYDNYVCINGNNLVFNYGYNGYFIILSKV